MPECQDELTAVVAATNRGVIGRDGDMPWRLSTDLRRFKRRTMGGTLIMGRKTFDSIGRPLPGRRTIVLTRNRQWSAAGVETAAGPDEAITNLPLEIWIRNKRTFDRTAPLLITPSNGLGMVATSTRIHWRSIAILIS